jgi:asparagine synthase (glutamine-hydrolysing)
MCGVLTWLSRGQTINRTRLESGLSALRHRGPDASGVVILNVPTPRSGLISVGLAHARLAILDPSLRANQPFRRGDHLLCYNGEIYNHRELAARYRIASRSTTSDTEVLLSLLASVGLAGLAEARGMWAFTWLDLTRRRLIAARDRYGKKPLFYVAGPTDIVLASEIRALRAVLEGSFVLQDEALATFLSEGWLLPQPDGTTHLQGVREVRPGHALVIDLDTWTLDEAPIDGLWPAPPTDGNLADGLIGAVADRLVSDRPIGLLLSGGLDSMLLLSVLAAQGGLERVTCFTGDAGKSDDAACARVGIAATGARAIEIPLDYGPASTDDFLAVCRSQEKPFPLIGNVLGMPALYRAMADHGVRVALDGTGADELFGGYWNRYAGFAMRDAARAGDTAWLTAIRAGGMLPPELARTSDAALLHEPLPCPANRNLPEDDCRWLSPAGLALIAQALPGDPLVNFPGRLSDALLRDARSGRMQEWLWQNDRNAMAAGVENRGPFLDHRLAGWMTTPYHAKFSGARNKCELRTLLEGLLPLPSAQRLEKQGFRWVYSRFLRQNRRWIADLVHGSMLVRRVCRIDALMADLDEDAADQRLLQRLIVLAGLEATGAVTVA